MSEPINPYKSPETVPNNEILEPSLIGENYQSMVDTRKPAVMSKILLTTYCSVFFLLAVWYFKLAYEFHTTEEYEGLGFISADSMYYIEASYTYLFLICAVSVAVWKFRSMKNAWAIMRSGIKPTVTPGWAVAWYIIPIASLWKPYVAMSEINNNSLSEPLYLKHWLKCWWSFYISSTVINIFSDSSNIDVDAQYLIVSGCSILLDIAAGICLIKIISKVTGAQMEVFDAKYKKSPVSII